MKSKREQLAELLKLRLMQVRYCEPSYAQQRMWYMDQLQPGNPAYNVPIALRLKGTVDQSVLQRSLNSVIKRHEILRTTFPVNDGTVRQKISPFAEVSLPIIDLRGRHELTRENEMRRIMNDEAQRSFDLSNGPLLAAVLVRLRDDDHVFVLVLHHIICDGWSLEVLVKDFAAYYEAHACEKPAVLPPMTIQYADFTIWQRNWLSGERLQRHLEFWRRQLQGLSVLQVPTDYPRPAIATNRGDREHFRLSADLSQRLRELSRQHRVTLFMTLLAAFQWLLARYSGQEDVGVGTFIANRNRMETEGLIGFFVNQLVLRTDVGGDPSFSELLLRARHTVLDAYEHQDLPFEKLVEELAPERNLRDMPFFRIQMVLQNTPAASINVPGLELSHMEPDRRVSKLDLSLFMHEKGDLLTGTMEYNTDIFRSSSVCRLLGHFETLLEEVSRHPEQPLSSLSWAMVSEAEDLQAAFSNSLEALEI